MDIPTTPKVFEALHTPTTDANIKKYFPDVNIIQYKDLKNYNSFEELCNNSQNACFLLYVNNKTPSQISGHWNCIMHNPEKGEINLFDSYGDLFNDHNLILIGKNRKMFGEEEPLLSNLILKDNSINKIYYNNKPYQMKNGSQTCGRHCIFRLLNKNLNNSQYLRLLNSLKKKVSKTSGVKPNYDELIINLVPFS
jgi:hypothetical protein